MKRTFSSLFRRDGLALLLGLSTLLEIPAAQAQAPGPYKVQVVTRTVEQALPCPAGTLVRIRAEKATVRVQGWDQPTARLVLKLSARHPERAVAEGELPNARYAFNRHGNTLDLLNYFAVTAGATALRSDLRAEYTLWVPAGVRLELRSLYGQTTLADLSGSQQLDQDFGQVTLANLRGNLRAAVRYADVTGTNTAGTLLCRAEKSSVRLAGAAGTCTVRNRYGSVWLEPAAGVQGIVVEAERSDVTLQVPQPELFNYQLFSAHGSLALPPRLAGSPRGAGGTTWQLAHGPGRPLLRVNTSYASITLQINPLTVLH